MLTCTQKELDVLAERYKDLREEAEQRRLLREARSGRPMAAPAHGRLFAWLGRRLAAWGWKLQKRYDPRAASSVLATRMDKGLVQR